MVATVGSISIDLSTNTHKFAQGFKSAATTVERESNRMSKAVKGIGGLGTAFIGGIAGGAAFAALGSLSSAIKGATQALSDFEAIGNRAKAAGLGTDFFQALSFGAEQADVETEALNGSLEIFAKNMGLASEGTGRLYSGLLKLNPELLRSLLTAKDQESRLKLIADAMSRMTDETQKAALATAVFGQGGQDMIRVLDGGSAALDRMQQHARELGIIIPPDMIERASKLDDQLSTLSTVIGVNLKEALASLGPALVKGAEGLAVIAKGLNALTTEIGEFMDAWNKGQEALTKRTVVDAAAAKVKNLRTEIEATRQEIINAAEAWTIWEDKPDTSKLEAKLDRLEKMAWGAFRAAEAAARGPASAAAGGKLPTVQYYGRQPVKIDPEVMDKVEDAIYKETEATKKAPYITGRYVDAFHRDTAGYFNNLNNTISSGLDTLNESMQDIIAMGGRGEGFVNTGTFKFSGLGSPGSWGGRRFTFTTPTGDYDPLASMLARPGTSAADASTITTGGGPINVSVVVKPVLEGQRLSSQSTAEIKQAAATGTNAALRAFYGR